MVNKVPRKRVASSKHSGYLKVALNFQEAATLAFDFEYYNAAGVLFIHSAIALADAVSIKLSSQKCTGDNHYEILNLLKEIAPNTGNKNNALKQLKNIIDHKNMISYSGEIYQRKDVDKIVKYFERFSLWAKGIIQ